MVFLGIFSLIRDLETGRGKLSKIHSFHDLHGASDSVSSVCSVEGS